jgi:hypothetical protein
VAKKSDFISLLAVGDVVVARKDHMTSFAKVADILKAGDITFFNCETPYAESGTPGHAQHGAIQHDYRKMPALATAGFNVCTMANNHVMDWGIDPVVECRERLEAMGIAVCGAGKDMAEARKPAIIEYKGTRVAFLGYLSTGPIGYEAEKDKPGAAPLRVHTLYEQQEYQPGTPPHILTWTYRDDLQAMVENIRQAREQADIVVVTDHWGLHNTPVDIPDYEYEIAYAAIDAGADLVLGTHPHILKGIEVYKGKVIVHSLANFVMENGVAERESEIRGLRMKSWPQTMAKMYGPRHPDQSKSMILKCIISDKKIQKVSFLPVQLDMEWANPEPLARSDQRAQDIYDYVVMATREAGIQTDFFWEEDEIVIRT